MASWSERLRHYGLEFHLLTKKNMVAALNFKIRFVGNMPQKTIS